jgi:hypothetical protein
MRRISFGLFGLTLIHLFGAASSACAADPTKPIALVTKQSDGGDLEGWKFFSEKEGTKIADVWKLQDGVLTCQGTPKGYIYTTKDYRNFTLTLEWRWVPDKKAGNGGVLIRMTGKHKIWPKSLEAQLNAGQAGDFWGLDGYHLAGPAERSKSLAHEQFGKLINVQKKTDLEKSAGEWNKYEIIARDGRVTLKINGKEVNEAQDCDLDAGRICLTAEGDSIQFRNVVVSEP